MEPRSAHHLNRHHGTSYTTEQWGDALENLKVSRGFRGAHHGAILENRFYMVETGEIIGPIIDYLF